MLLGTTEGVQTTREGLVLPAHLREGLRQGYVITRGLDGCAVVFPLPIWETLSERVERGTSLLRVSARLFQRYLYGGASVGELGCDGLLRIPEHLRHHAELQDEVVLVGVGNRLEIWNPQRWSHEEFRMNERSLTASQDLSELGV